MSKREEQFIEIGRSFPALTEVLSRPEGRMAFVCAINAVFASRPAADESAKPETMTAATCKYFVNDPYLGEFVELDSEAEREAAHDEAIRNHLDGDEWDEGAGDIVSGIITHRTREYIETVEDIGESYTYDQEAFDGTEPATVASKEAATLSDEDMRTILDAPVANGENVFYSIVFGLGNSDEVTQRLIVEEIVRTILAAQRDASKAEGQ